MPTPEVGDYIWFLVGEQLEGSKRNLRPLCLVPKRFHSIFTKFLYRHVYIYGMSLHNLRALTSSRYLNLTQTLFIAGLGRSGFFPMAGLL